MDVFHTDLDRTMIYSYQYDKHSSQQDDRSGKRNVERYQGREISFLTQRTFELLQEVKKHVLIVPTTTRTTEQYERINLGIGTIEYALTCNGGVLLKCGESDEAWYQRSLEMIKGSRHDLQIAAVYLQAEKSRLLEVRFIQDLFLFTKSSAPESVVANLQGILDPEQVDVFHNGEKVYVIPKNLNKGTAVARFREYIGAKKVYAAGDSIFDYPMLDTADIALAPSAYHRICPHLARHIHTMPGKKIFSEELLEELLAYQTVTIDQ